MPTHRVRACADFIAPPSMLHVPLLPARTDGTVASPPHCSPRVPPTMRSNASCTDSSCCRPSGPSCANSSRSPRSTRKLRTGAGGPREVHARQQGVSHTGCIAGCNTRRMALVSSGAASSWEVPLHKTCWRSVGRGLEYRRGQGRDRVEMLAAALTLPPRCAGTACRRA